MQTVRTLKKENRLFAAPSKLDHAQKASSAGASGWRKKPLPSRARKVYYHDGAWEFNRIEDCNAWSCCMGTKKNGRGCKYYTIDPDRWDFASPP